VRPAVARSLGTLGMAELLEFDRAVDRVSSGLTPVDAVAAHERMTRRGAGSRFRPSFPGT